MDIIGSIDTFFCFPKSFEKKKYFFKKYFFLSWSEAMLFLFKHHKVSREDYLLLPNFFCPATLAFLAKNGKVLFYEINDDFSVNKESYFLQIEKFKPKVIVNFSLVGFNLNEDEEKKLQALVSNEAILIEDYAHQIIDAEPKKLFTGHYYIDSIRKHSSLLGAHLVNFEGRVEGVERFNWYKFLCQFYRFCQNFCFLTAKIFSSTALYKMGYWFFLKLDEIVGESPVSTFGPIFSFHLYNLLDLKKINKNCRELLLSYNTKFNFFPKKYLTTLNDDILASSGLVSCYPVLINSEIKNDLLKFLNEYKIFAEELWEYEETNFGHLLNKKLYEQLVIFPLSSYLRETDIKRIQLVVENYLKVLENK